MMRLVFYHWQAPPKTAETNKWKDVGRMGKDERKLGSWGSKFESNAEHTCIHQVKYRTVSSLFHPVPKTVGTSRPIALLPSFFLHLEALQVEPLEDPPLRHASYLLPRALPNDSNEVEKPPKNRDFGFNDNLDCGLQHPPETNSIDIWRQLLVELNFCLCLPKGLTCYATKEHILEIMLIITLHLITGSFIKIMSW